VLLFPVSASVGKVVPEHGRTEDKIISHTEMAFWQHILQIK